MSNPSTIAEYKLVTILFADVVSSTELGERVGPEMQRVLLSRCLQRLSAAVEAYGGMVARLMGDGLLSFFGSPQAHEDDPERAAFAAIQMQAAIAEYSEELAFSLQIRIGINTGRAVLGEVGGELASEFTAMGSPVVLAQRLQAAARPGETLVGEATARLIRHRFELEPPAALKLKGFEQPVRACLLIAERAIPQSVKGIEGLYSPLVGRDMERQRFAEKVIGLESGQGGIVSVIGEPGIGKSRLLQETREHAGSRPISWMEGRAYSYTEDQPFSVILDLLTELLDLTSDDSPAMVDLKLDLALTPLFVEQLEEVWPYLATILGSPVPARHVDLLLQLDPAAIQSKTINAVQLLVERLAREKPLVLAFEDLHWADPSSIKLLHALLYSCESAPVLLVFLFRPERNNACWELKLKAETHFAHRYLELLLSPLDDLSSQALVENLLALAEFPASLRYVILEKSEGNPFYVEELIRELIERQILVRRGESWKMVKEFEGLEIPETLEKVVQARLDRLSPHVRFTLQAASVIGRRFAYRVLEVMTKANGDLPSHLLRLQQADLVRERARLPDLEYIFKHVIVQEVTYSTLLDERRRQLHRQAADAIERLFAERRDELLGALARHYDAAGENAKAIELYHQAGERAQAIHAHEEALGYLENAIELARPGEYEAKLSLLLEHKADVLNLMGRGTESIPCYKETLEREQTRQAIDSWSLLRLHRKIGGSVAQMHRIDDMMAFEGLARESFDAGQLLTVQEPTHPESILLWISLSSFYGRYILGPPDWDKAEGYARQAVEAAEQLDQPTLLASALGMLALVLYARGMLKEYLETCLHRMALSDAEEFNDLRERARILHQTGTAYKNMGQYRQAMDHLTAAEALAREINDIELQAAAMGEQAETWCRLDQWEKVLGLEDTLLNLHHRYGLSRAGPLCFSIGIVGSVYALRGELEASNERRREAYEIMTSSGARTEAEWIRNQHY